MTKKTFFAAPSILLKINFNIAPVSLPVAVKIPDIIFTATGSQGPYIWTCKNLPNGLSFANGVLSGIPINHGVHSIAL